jgi:hypothetical protein
MILVERLVAWLKSPHKQRTLGWATRRKQSATLRAACAFGTQVSGSEAEAVRHGERHRSRYGKIGGKPQPLRVAPADCGMLPALRRSAAFELRDRSLPLGIRQRDLAGRPRETRLAAVGVEAAADYKRAVDERIQPERPSVVPSGKPTIFSFCNLASSHLMQSQVCHENTNNGRPPGRSE